MKTVAPWAGSLALVGLRLRRRRSIGADWGGRNSRRRYAEGAGGGRPRNPVSSRTAVVRQEREPDAMPSASTSASGRGSVFRYREEIFGEWIRILFHREIPSPIHVEGVRVGNPRSRSVREHGCARAVFPTCHPGDEAAGRNDGETLAPNSGVGSVREHAASEFPGPVVVPRRFPLELDGTLRRGQSESGRRTQLPRSNSDRLSHAHPTTEPDDPTPRRSGRPEAERCVRNRFGPPRDALSQSRPRPDPLGTSNRRSRQALERRVEVLVSDDCPPGGAFKPVDR